MNPEPEPEPVPVPNPDCSVMVEIRAGTGGGEANLWAGDLVTAYTKYGQAQGWNVRIVESTDGDDGGYKNAVVEVCDQWLAQPFVH